MAVPVINVSSVTKPTSTFAVYWHAGGSVTSSTTYIELSSLRIPNAVDGEKLFVNFVGYDGAGHSNGAIRISGVTSGTVLKEYDHASNLTPFHQFGFWNHTKSTGVTEDIKVEVKSNSSSFHSDHFIHSGRGEFSIAGVDKGNSIRTTLQIDSIDMVAIGGNASSWVGCPAIGFSASTTDTAIKSFTPNLMLNSLDFTNGYNNVGTQKDVLVLYNYGGKKLVMS